MFCRGQPPRPCEAQFVFVLPEHQINKSFRVKTFDLYNIYIYIYIYIFAVYAYL